MRIAVYIADGSTPGEVKVGCPHCDGHIEVGPEWFGLEASCPHCGEGFMVPDGDGSLGEHGAVEKGDDESPGDVGAVGSSPSGVSLAYRMGRLWFQPGTRGRVIRISVVLAVVVVMGLLLRGGGGDGSDRESGDANSGRPSHEEEYIEQLQDVRASLKYAQRMWADLGRLAQFPSGIYWRGMPADRAQRELRWLENAPANAHQALQTHLLTLNHLDRLAGPLLAARPELKPLHESVCQKVALGDITIGDPFVALELERIRRAVDEMMSELAVD